MMHLKRGAQVRRRSREQVGTEDMNCKVRAVPPGVLEITPMANELNLLEPCKTGLKRKSI